MGELDKKIKQIVESALIPYGYKTVYIGVPYEVSASQFLYKRMVDKLIQELVEFYDSFNSSTSNENLSVTENEDKKEFIGCTCKQEDKHGWTTIKCCNECGKPIEPFWVHQ